LSQPQTILSFRIKLSSVNPILDRGVRASPTGGVRASPTERQAGRCVVEMAGEEGTPLTDQRLVLNYGFAPSARALGTRRTLDVRSMVREPASMGLRSREPAIYESVRAQRRLGPQKRSAGLRSCLFAHAPSHQDGWEHRPVGFDTRPARDRATNSPRCIARATRC
jgi:hypothetical protein